MTYRQLLSNIINGVTNLDADAEVVILFRDKNRCCINKKIIKISHTSMNGRICIEQDDIDKAINYTN
jgi:hypothetical protein